MVKVRAYLAPINEGDSGQIKDLQSTIDNLNEQIRGYLQNIQDLESQVNVKDSLLEAKESEINAKLLEIGELQGQITLLTSDKETMQTNIDELTKRVTQLEDEVETLNSLIESYQSQIESKDSQISTLTSEKTQLENELSDSELTNEILTRRVAELEEQLENSGNSEELEAANARIAELEGQVNTLTDDKTNLQSQIDELLNQIGNVDLSAMYREVFSNIIKNADNCRYVTASANNNAYLTSADVQLRGKGVVLIITHEAVNSPYADDSERPPCEWGSDEPNKVNLILKYSEKSTYETNNYYLMEHDNSYYWTKLPLCGTIEWNERSYVVLYQEGAYSP